MAVVQIVSAVLCTLPAFGTIAGESLWLLTPHNNSAKLAGRSQIIKLYGALCCLRNMHLVDGIMGVCIMVPLIVCLWAPVAAFSSPVAALIANLCLASGGPFLMAVGVFLALVCPVDGSTMGGVGASTSVVFAVFGLILGGNLAWRSLDPVFLMPPKYIPVVAGWHLICTVIFMVYGTHFVGYISKLKYSIKLEQMKDDAVTAGATFIRGDSSPVGHTASNPAANHRPTYVAQAPLSRSTRSLHREPPFVPMTAHRWDSKPMLRLWPRPRRSRRPWRSLPSGASFSNSSCCSLVWLLPQSSRRRRTILALTTRP